MRACLNFVRLGEKTGFYDQSRLFSIGIALAIVIEKAAEWAKKTFLQPS